MNTQDPGSHDDERRRLTSELSELATASRRYSNVRLLSFLVFLGGLAATLESSLFLPLLVAPAAVVFTVVFVMHGTVQRRHTEASLRLTLISEVEQRMNGRRRDHDAPALGDAPSRLEAGLRVYAAELESYPFDSYVADDLQVYSGPRNLFGFLDWTSTTFGVRRLQRLICHPLRHVDDIVARQAAAREIAEKGDVRESILLSLLPLRRYDLSPLAHFFAEPPTFAHRKGLLVFASLTGTLAPLIVLSIAFTGKLEYGLPLVILIMINLFTIGSNLKESNRVRDRLLLFGPLLEAWARLAEQSQRANWESDEWKKIHSVFESVRGAVHRLGRHVRLLSLHSYGVIFELINVLTLWELRILPLADAVFTRHREELEAAAGAMGETEALACLSLPITEQVEFSMPVALASDDPRVQAEEIGHPLLDPETCVRNSLSLGESSTVWVVTGSNMSGKSTYLKSVGLNLVLAGIGTAVCGRDFQWTPMALHTDVNIRDSLDDGKSYFQVEVERVFNTIEAARQNRKVIALFDQLFRGTNSDERLAISRAVVRYLRSTGALLIVATHDRSLTHLVTEDAEQGMENRHLRDDVKDDAMHFDYLLRDGAAVSRNAIRVLELQNYPEEIVSEARSFLSDA